MDGEKELVLGNKQLVSFFFVVLALCGVFFALGYMIGRNSGKVTVAGLDGSPGMPATSAPLGQSAFQTSEPPRETTADPAANVASAPAAEGSSSNGNGQSVIETAPQRTASAEMHTQPAHDTPESPVPTPERAGNSPASQLVVPEEGAMYLQVRALHRGDAETLVRTLREQGYPTALATSSKPDFFRVLVGPYHQTAQLADTKARLKTLGFADAFVLR